MDISLFAIFVAALVYFCIGMLWYSSCLFGSFCYAEKIPGCGEKGCRFVSFSLRFLAEFALNFLLAAVLGFFIYVSESSTYSEGLLLVSLIWLGFIVPTSLSGVIWGNKTWKGFLVHALFALIGLSAMSAVIIGMR